MKNEVRIYTDRGVVPVPKGWTKDDVVTVLKECGHKILRVEEPDKEIKEAV